MSLSILWSEPQQFTAGDTVQWSRALSDFPSTAYALWYQLRGPQEINITSAVYQTSNYLVTLTAAQTAAFKAGRYSIVPYVKDLATGLTRYAPPVIKARFPFLTVLENPQNYTAGSASNLSWAAQTLALVESTITKLANRSVVTASVNGQTYSLQDMAKLLSLRQRMAEIVRSEEDAINVAAGLGGKKNILVRFPPLNNGLPPFSPGEITPSG